MSGFFSRNLFRSLSVRRVSSQAMAATSPRTRRALRVMSSRLPTGVPTMKRRPVTSLFSPVVGIEEVVAGGSRRELGDRRQLALEFRILDHPQDAGDDGRPVPRFDHLPAAPAVCDEAAVDLFVRLLG